MKGDEDDELDEGQADEAGYYDFEDEIADAVGAIAKLAGVPVHMRASFCREFEAIIVRTFHGNFTPYFKNRALLEAERAVRAAKDAFDRLDEGQRQELHFLMRTTGPLRPPKPEDSISAIVEAFAKVTGKSAQPIPKDKVRGRRKGSVENWPFQCIVEALFTIPDRHGGHLVFNGNYPEKNKVGGALEILRALFRDPGLIPDPLPLKTIERIKSRCSRKTTLPQ
jgi:hypothetical protein